jgi:hypothetical protein
MLAIRNGLNTTSTLSLLILLEVRIWRKKDGWNGPYKLLVINGEIYIIKMPYRPTNFQLTIIKLYYVKEEILDIPE